MAQDKLHKIYNPEDFRRYQNGEMPFSEQHLLERQMMEDPFLAEAYEGFVALNADEVNLEKSVEEIQDRLQARVSNKTGKMVPLWAYSAAATIFIFLGIGWLFYTSNQNTLTDRNSKSATAIAIDEKIGGKAVIGPSIASTEKTIGTKSPSIVIKPRNRARATDLNKTNNDSENKLNSRKEENLAVSDEHFQSAASPVTVPAQSNASRIIENEIVKGILVDENGAVLAGVTILNSDHTTTQTGEKGEFSINSRMGDSITAAFIGYKSKKIKVEKADMGMVKLEPDHLTLNEVVVIGYGVQKKQSMAVSSRDAGYGQPEPADGWAQYQEYLDKFRDSSLLHGLVKVSFAVNNDGTLSEFKTEGTKELFDEALKVIKTGPAWKPFKSNGLEPGKRAQVTVRFGKQ